MMADDRTAALTFETLFTDPLIRLVMARDGVSPRDMIAALEVAREAVALRERQAVETAAAGTARWQR